MVIWTFINHIITVFSVLRFNWQLFFYVADLNFASEIWFERISLRRGLEDLERRGLLRRSSGVAVEFWSKLPDAICFFRSKLEIPVQSCRSYPIR